MEFDRRTSHVLVLALENYVSRQRSIVTRASASGPLAIAEIDETASAAPSEDVLENGMLFPVITEPWVRIGKALTNPQHLETATVNIQTESSTVAAPRGDADRPLN